jgi:hypothetical protein
MNHVAGTFLSAVLALVLIGSASAGAADEPIAVAPIPPPAAAEPLTPATPLMVPATSPPTRKPYSQRSQTGPCSPPPTSESTDRARRPKRPLSHHAARKTSRGKPAGEKAAADKRSAEEAAVAAAAEAAERETARRRAAELGRERYQGARRTRPPASSGHPPWASSPDEDTADGDGTFGRQAYDGPDQGGVTQRPAATDQGQPRYDAEYPRQPAFYGPAYPPPWYNGPQPKYYPGEPYPGRWGPAPPPPW